MRGRSPGTPLLQAYSSTRSSVLLRRWFHDYFVTHLPSSSLHPDSKVDAGSRHQLPRSTSKPHPRIASEDPSPAPVAGINRDTTVVRIPLRSAKHHFGVSVSRGTRPYNEDTYQAGVIELPAFTKRRPRSVTRATASGLWLEHEARKQQECQASGQRDREAGGQDDRDRREHRHQKVREQRNQEAREDCHRLSREQNVQQTESQKAQRPQHHHTFGNGEIAAAEGTNGDPQVFYFGVFDGHGGSECSEFLRSSLHTYVEKAAEDFHLQSTLQMPPQNQYGFADPHQSSPKTGQTASPNTGVSDPKHVIRLETQLVTAWRDLVGGYFRRFKPKIFADSETSLISISTVMTYAFLKADLDFVSAQARKCDDDDSIRSDAPLNDLDVFDSPALQIGGKKRFKGGSTCSLAMISTPTPMPFWHPSTPSTLAVAHVGDTRILLCRTSDGTAIPVTSNHHPSNPVEAQRLRRYAGSFVTDSFGEERMSGLANTRAFGDMASKRTGVSAEPETRLVELTPAQFSFMVLMSDGISGTLRDQEIVDIIKEAKTPDQGAKDVVAFATEVSDEGDNATCIVVRLGGWERRCEGGLGSMGTRESRDFRRQGAIEPRSRRS